MSDFDYKTVINQLTNSDNGMNRLVAMTGANRFLRDDKNKSISFKFKGSRKWNYVRITLNAMDTYDVLFMKIWGSKEPKELLTEGLYSDMLQKHFENETKLYLTL